MLQYSEDKDRRKGNRSRDVNARLFTSLLYHSGIGAPYACEGPAYLASSSWQPSGMAPTGIHFYYIAIDTVPSAPQYSGNMGPLPARRH